MSAQGITKGLLTLVRAGLWNKPVDHPGCFPLAAQEWAMLFELAINHTVEGIVFDGIQQLAPALMPPSPLLIKWLVRVEKIAQRNTWMDSMVNEQAVFLKDLKIQPLLLKGQGLSACYHRPERRSCGDVDWYFASKSAYARANAAVKEQQINLDFMPGYSSAYFWKGCEVEHHSRLLDLHNPFIKKYLRRLEADERKSAIVLPLRDTEVLLPSPLLQSLQVNVHILKHLLSFGIGLRQICDAARVYHTYHQQIDGAKLHSIYHHIKIVKWIHLFHELLIAHLGLPPENLPFPVEGAQPADWLLQEILTAGNFGFYDPRHVTGENRAKGTILRNARKYFPFAPIEACCFPMVHFSSRFFR